MKSKLYRFFGIRRSGNHAIIRWFFDRLEGKGVHLDDVKTDSLNPYDTFARATTKGYSYFTFKRSVVGYLNFISRGPQYPVFVIQDQNLRVNVLSSIGKDFLIVSYEDILPTDKSILSFDKLSKQYDITYDEYRDIIILRYPYNLFSSLIKSGMADDVNIGYYIDLYKQYITLYMDNSNSYDFILFNKWFTSYDYKSTLSSKFSLPLESRYRDTVLDVGGGSSFDGVNLSTNPSSMKVNQRWNKMRDHHLMSAVFENDILHSFSKEVFDVTIST